MPLPYVAAFQTPAFVEGLDVRLDGKKIGPLSLAGSAYRMWVLLLTQALTLLLAMLIGLSITSELPDGQLPNVFYACNFIRYIGCGLLMLSALVGLYATHLGGELVLAVTIVLQGLGGIIMFLAWTIDSSNTATLSSSTNVTVEDKDGADVKGQRYTRGVFTVIFGVFGWIVAVVSFVLLYAIYQDGGASGSPSSSSPQQSNVGAPESAPARRAAPTPAPRAAAGAAPKVADRPFSAAKTANEISGPTDTTHKHLGGPKSSTPPIVSLEEAQRRQREAQAKFVPKVEPAPAGGNSSNEVACPSCGASWSDDTTFCGDCGSALSAKKRGGVPAGWEQFFTDDGQEYWFNPATDETKWPYEYYQ